MKKKHVFFAVMGLIGIAIVVYLLLPEENIREQVSVPVTYGDFEIAVTTTGELEAKDSREIYGPSGLREFRIWQVKINDMIPDGTVVDSGDWVADLDQSEIINSKKDLETELEKLNSQYIKTKLDTSMTLRQAREELINLEFALEEQKIRLEQSKFEPPATIRQIKIDVKKAKRNLEQAGRNYHLKKEKAEAEMSEVMATLNQQQRKYASLKKVVDKFRVTAPEAGMVVYKRNWRGEKQAIGATINTGWDNVVAELPDLSKMRSKTYVNEVDISKVEKGQEVEISVDAFPDNSYNGVVESVANIGQQMNNSNAKVFEVMIDLKDNDSILRPAMTTKNKIITDVFEQVVYVPIEAIHYSDFLTYVVTSDKKRKEVSLGKSNENHIIIEEGLDPEDEIYLLPPEGYESYRLISLKEAE
jgi:multidrug efflux pump subunit AcrA (membrane-fusion protein)